MANPEPEPEIIEVVEEVLNNEMFLAACAVGAVIGGIVIYLYLQNKGALPSLRMTPQPPAPMMDLPASDEDEYTASEGG